MSASTLVLFFVLALLFVAGTMALFSLVVRRIEGRPEGSERGPIVAGAGPRRPWWGNPLLWLAVAGFFAVLGIFVAPYLFGGVILFLPFVWVGNLGRRGG